jgi:hypothetical protein
MYELQNYGWKIKKSASAVPRLQINFFSRITRPQAKKVLPTPYDSSAYRPD